MMKNFFTIFLILVSSSFYSQTKIAGSFYQRDNSFKAYDSVNNITEINDFGTKNKIFIKGKWKDFDLGKYHCDEIITHCPLLINKDKIILETWIRKEEEYYNWKKESHREIFLKLIDYTRHSKEGEYVILEDNKIENYITFKVNLPGRKKKERINGILLLGVKDNKIYRLAIQNYIEGQLANIEEFLTGIYFSN